MTCTVPPLGWYCTRAAGHEPPCAAVPNHWRKDCKACGGTGEYVIHAQLRHCDCVPYDPDSDLSPMFAVVNRQNSGRKLYLSVAGSATEWTERILAAFLFMDRDAAVRQVRQCYARDLPGEYYVDEVYR